MKYIARYLIFVMIGVFPTIIAGYSIITWEWWAIVLTLDIGVVIHDAVGT